MRFAFLSAFPPQSATADLQAPGLDKAVPFTPEQASSALSAQEIAPPPIAQPQYDSEPGIPPSAPASATQSNPGAAIAAQMGVDALNDEEALVAALEKDPKALAQDLNKIEPSRTDASKAVPSEKSEPKKAALKETPKEKQSATITPADELKPDASLPPVVKQIEDKAFNGNAEAQHDLAAIYTAGHGGVRQDYARAAAWFERAAQGNVANAAYNLGVLYHQGLGVKPDIKKALTWYQKAAEQNHPEAQYNLGIAYIEGIGVDYDPQKAKTYFENAADQKVMEAAYNLGLIYENGLLGPSAPDEALMWYKTAADQGAPEAKAALEQLAKNLSLSQKDVERIVEETRRLRKPSAASSSRTAPPARTSSQKAPEQEIVKKAQDYLMRAGLYPGPADGKPGPLMRDAVRSYQALNGLHIDGEVSTTLLSHMESQPKLR
ncbi:MAG: SEL1-like repeat protein [Alphaproteobacteria bacterium]|nr:SEL1-like repeat protein [Alphaproteobacteria bacterium]